MPENAAVGAARLMAMVSWISRHEGHTVTVGQIADHFGRSVRQVEKDVDHLTYFRDSRPVDSFELVWTPSAKGARNKERRSNLVTIRQAHGASLSSVFTEDLGTRTILSLRAMAPALSEDLAQWVPSTVMWIEGMSAVPAEILQAIDDVDNEDSVFLSRIRHAVDSHQVIEIVYQKDLGVPQRRELEPCSLRRGPHGWLLSALDRGVGQHRTFSVSRILDVADMGSLFPSHGQCESSGVPYVRVGLRQQAMWLVDDYADFVERFVDDSGLVVVVADIPVWSFTAVRDLLVSAGAHVVFIKDEEMNVAVREHACAGAHAWSEVLSFFDACDVSGG